MDFSLEEDNGTINLQIPPAEDADEICIAAEYLPLLRRSLQRVSNGDTGDPIIADGGDEAIIACAVFDERTCPVCHDEETKVVGLKRFDFEAGKPELWGVYCDDCRRSHYDAVETYIEENIGSVLISTL